MSSRSMTDTTCCAEGQLTGSATSGAFYRLKGVRLGRRERELLLAAPTPAEVDAAVASKRSADEAEAASNALAALAMHMARNYGSGITGMLPITGPTRSVRVARQRAAKKLLDIGLVEYSNQIYGERRVCVGLTPLGLEVVERYRHELETGRRIRWGIPALTPSEAVIA